MELQFINNVQAALFTHEIKGQLSDGFWENTRPQNHWKIWCGAQVTVGENIGREYRWVDKDNYNFVAKELLDCVGYRMLGIARLALAEYPSDIIGMVNSCWGEDMVFELPTYTGKYWDGLRDRLNELDLEVLAAVLVSDKHYSMQNLRFDLKAMKATVRTVREL